MIVISVPASNNQLKLKNDEYLEYRLDLQTEAGKTDHLKIDERTIITWRQDTENKDQHKQKKELFTLLVEQTNCLIDIELENYHYYQELSKNMILSVHYDDFDREKIQATLQEFHQKKARIYKLVVKADKYSQLMALREMTEEFPHDLFVLSTGALSIFSRIMYRYLNSIGTYLGIDGQYTAPNQIDRDFFYLLKSEQIDSQSLLGGLIGGAQIYQSRGYQHYNHLREFAENNAFYLPFFTDEIDDLLSFIRESGLHFYGFSITMPYKYMGKKAIPANYYLPNKEIYGNTDIIALREGLNKLEIKPQNSILILGSGATAESALIALKENKHQMTRVSLFARNKERAQNLNNMYSTGDYKEKVGQYDLLINCTPIGLQNEDLSLFLNGIVFKKLIDLPYLLNGITPICQQIKPNDCFSGSEFWQAQAEYQLAIFIESIFEQKKRG